MKIHVKQNENLIIPATATTYSAGYDVVALTEPKIIGQQIDDVWKSIDYVEYHTGLFTAPQTDTYGHNYHTLVFPRSSVRKYNLILANCIGLIDNDYRGEIILCFKYIWQPEDYVIKPIGFVYGKPNMEKMYKKGDKIGQLVAEVTNTIDWVVVADLSATQRGEGGFGSTTNKKIDVPKEAVSLINKWKEISDTPIPQKYETIVKEREKLIS